MDSSFTLLIADEQLLFVEGLKHSMARIAPNINVVSCFSALDALQIVRQGGCFDAILLHETQVFGDFVACLEQINDINPRTPIFVMRNLGGRSMLHNGRNDLVKAVIDRCATAEDILETLFHALEPKEGETDAARNWTPRQLQVLHLLAEGLPNKVICRRLQIGEPTLKTHLRAVYRRLGVNNRTACVIEAGRYNILGHARAAMDELAVSDCMG
jgi:DNA-binding NarL/FixJ family response regulator